MFCYTCWQRVEDPALKTKLKLVLFYIRVVVYKGEDWGAGEERGF